MSKGSGINFDADNEIQCGADAESDEDDGAFFDTNYYLASEFIRSASCRSRDSVGNGCSSMMHESPSSFPNQSPELQMGIRLVKYPYVNRRDSLPDPKEKDKPIGLWSVIKDNIGKNLSGVCLPVYFNEPLSSLQKCFEDLEYSGLVDQASEWGKKVHGFVHDNQTGEKVAMLIGKWDEAMYYVLGDPATKPKGYDPMTEAVLLWERDNTPSKTRYNLTPFAISLNEMTPGLREKLPPTDSRIRPDQRHLENGEYEMANAEKLRLQQLQRRVKFNCSAYLHCRYKKNLAVNTNFFGRWNQF